MVEQKRIKDLGPDAPIVTNAKGGEQSACPYAFHLLDGDAMFRLASILAYGAERYEPNNWRRIDLKDHLNHALQHIMAYLAGDTQDDHLGHAFCRMMFVIAMEEEGQVYDARAIPKVENTQ